MLTVLGVLVHELGHLAACVRYHASHGGIGVGLYWCVPVFFAEVHGAWLLARQQRAVVDAGGLYLQSVYLALLGATYLVSEAPAVLAAIVCSHYLMLHTLNPVLKYDGYWLLSDLTGVHNLHQSVRRIAAGACRALWLGHGALLPAALSSYCSPDLRRPRLRTSATRSRCWATPWRAQPLAPSSCGRRSMAHRLLTVC